MLSVIIRAACIAAIVGSPLIASSQHYYVVVGAFAADENASEFKGYLPQQADTFYTNSNNEHALHFYVLKTSDKQSAISKSNQLKQQIETWKGAKTEIVKNTPEQGVSGPVDMRLGSASQNDKSSVADPANDAGSAGGAASSSLANAGKIPAPPVGKYFKFEIEGPEGGPIPAKVHHVDFDKGMELASYNANTFVDLLRPGHADKPMAVVCGVFGYKEVHKYIDYGNPSATVEEAFVDSQGTWVIPYKLERVEKGDVSLMYNVSFYKDAVVMRKPSRTDLDELVKMMHNNPYYEITVHAHCNGKGKREIIALGTEKNYFDASGSVKVEGSAKHLTILRAEAVRSYLVDHGVDPGRIEIFPWGASDMLVKPDGPHANLNDRVEIEFTRD
jgi:outer membrane protein OmpA-like peptidoglycan-associated protein